MAGRAPVLASPAERAEWALDRALARVGVDYLQVLWRLGRLPHLFRRMVAGATPARGEGLPGAGLQ